MCGVDMEVPLKKAQPEPSPGQAEPEDPVNAPGELFPVRTDTREHGS